MRFFFVGLVAAAPLWGCLSPTEIDITVTSDELCSVATNEYNQPREVLGNTAWLGIQATDINVGGPTVFNGGGGVGASSSSCDGGYLGKFVVIPSGNPGPVDVLVVAGLGMAAESCFLGDGGFAAKCIVARRQYRYEPHKAVAATIVLSKSCEGTVCDSDSTCEANRACVPLASCDYSGCDAGATSPSDASHADN